MNLFEFDQPTIPIAGREETFPVRRIYCIGRNYAAHVAEMGYDVERSRPVFFAKPADAIAMSGSTIPYPSQTENLHHEIEMVIAIGRPGTDIAVDDALSHVYGYAVGIDLTRRDLQAECKENRQPWEISKGFDHSAPISAIHAVGDVGHPQDARIWLAVNGQIRQDGNVNALIWSVEESIAELSTFFALAPGDLVFTGTPDGVGAIVSGDVITGGIEGIDEIEIPIE